MIKSPYSGIAPYYDKIIKGIEWEKWVDYAYSFLAQSVKNPEAIADFGAGTGLPTKYLLKKGIKVYAVEESIHMVKELRKNYQIEDNLLIVHGDMTEVTLPEKVDGIFSFFDTLNYLLYEDTLLRCFKTAYKNLKTKGAFIFDVNTIHSLKTLWNKRTFVNRDKKVISIWESRFSEMSKISTLRLTLFVHEKKDIFKMIEEVHMERGYELTTYKELMSNAGFKRIEIYKHLTNEPPNASTNRVLIVGRKG